MVPLGDPHNFGKRVCLINPDKIFKPRNLFWEWLFLGRESPLRARLEVLCSCEGLVSPLSLFPILSLDRDGYPLTIGGTLERLQTFAATAENFPVSKWRDLGSAIAAMVFFGMGDLHRQNVVFGVNSKKIPVFGPLDIECLWGELNLPMEANLLPGGKLTLKDCGLCDVISFHQEFPDPSRVVALVLGYLESIDFLSRVSADIELLLDSLDGIEKVPVRVILRNTRSYYSYLNGIGLSEDEPELHATERQQLERGDIPYYQRLVGSHHIEFFGADGWTPANLEGELNKQAMARLPTGRYPNRDPSRIDRLRKGGACQLLRYFDLGTEGEIEFSGIWVEYKGDRIRARWNALAFTCFRGEALS